ncbi:MAG: glycosyltransferase family 4 protein [Candidatus Omnitrophota bacterium]
MKILIINHEFPPAGGGAATACASMAKYLVREGVEIEVLTSRLKGYPAIETKDGYSIKRCLGFRQSLCQGSILEVLFFTIHGFFYFPRRIKNNKPDKVFAFFSLPSGMLGLFIKRKLKIPYYVFLRGFDVPGFYAGKFSFLNKILKPLIKYIWINADKIIANSQSLKELALKTSRKKEINVIPNGVDTEIFFPSGHKKDSDKIRLLFVGRLNKQKGLIYLLDSIQKVVQDGFNNFALEIAGEGPETNLLKRRSETLNIAYKVIFNGWCDRDTLVKKYQEADIFINPSLDEGMPNAVLEAMACGLPIIASDIPAHRELIVKGEEGMLIQIKDYCSLSHAIELMISNAKLRDKFEKATLKRAHEHNWKNICHGILN